MIRLATIEDLPKIEPLAKQFYSDSRYLQDFSIEIFVENWKKIIAGDIGVIFIIVESDKIVGILGGMKYPDINSGRLVATELFWYVDKEHRGRGGELLRLFEGWAKGMGCKKIIMVHMADLMPDKLKTIYKRKGYTEMEVHYVKEVR